jgi:hypothetical protein
VLIFFLAIILFSDADLTLFAAAFTQKSEDLFDHCQAQGQVCKRTAHTAVETPDLDNNQVAAQVAAYTQTVLGILDVF